MTIYKAQKLSNQAKALFNRICKDASQKNGGAGWGDNFPKHSRLVDKAWERWERRYKALLKIRWGDEHWNAHWSGRPR